MALPNQRAGGSGHAEVFSDTQQVHLNKQSPFLDVDRKVSSMSAISSSFRFNIFPQGSLRSRKCEA